MVKARRVHKESNLWLLSFLLRLPRRFRAKATVLRKYCGIKARRILQKDTIKAQERKDAPALYIMPI